MPVSWGGIGHDVDGRPGLQRADGDGAAFAVQRTPEINEPDGELRCGLQGVNAIFRLRAMSAFAADGDGKRIGRGVELTVPDPDGPERQLRRDVRAKHGVHAAQASRVHKALRAAAALFIRLE